jgi:hypothetical protein
MYETTTVPLSAPLPTPPCDASFVPSRVRCSEHVPICHLFKLILVIRANTSNGTNHIVQHVFVGLLGLMDVTTN